MPKGFHEGNDGEAFIPLMLAEDAQALRPGETIAINPHTRVTKDLSFGGPCVGNFGRVLVEQHGITHPQAVTVVRCEADGCQAAFFPHTVSS